MRSRGRHLEIILPAARRPRGRAPETHEPFVIGYLRLVPARIAQGTLDEQRPRSLAARPARARARRARRAFEPALAGGAPGSTAPRRARRARSTRRIDASLRLLTEGQTNAEMAAALEMSEPDLASDLPRVRRPGASSRAEATTLAFRGLGAAAGLVAATGRAAKGDSPSVAGAAG